MAQQGFGETLITLKQNYLAERTFGVMIGAITSSISPTLFSPISVRF